VGGKRSPARLVVALSVAAVLAIFLVYTALAGGGTPSLKPSQLAGHAGRVSLVGKVVGSVRGESHSTGGMRFRVQDIGGSKSVPVVYHGSVPDLFRTGRHVVVDGRVRNGTFVAVPGTLVTKCPSKYTPKG
jgi:cytochrome c-type biogenesis protein CcmE